MGDFLPLPPPIFLVSGKWKDKYTIQKEELAKCTEKCAELLTQRDMYWSKANHLQQQLDEVTLSLSRVKGTICTICTICTTVLLRLSPQTL